MKTASKESLRTFILRMAYAAVCLALCMVLPFLTGQLPEIGSAICPMHIPVLLAGFLCGPWWAMAVGAVAPLLRFALFAMPPIFPTGTALGFELAAYGLVSGLLYTSLPRKNSSIYIALITAMAAGRVVWGAAMAVISGITESVFTWSAFMSGAFLNAIPGIIIHILLIPVIVMALRRAGLAR